MRNKGLVARRYYGGKSPLRETGPWIAKQLPDAPLYVEPFGGMAGVMLQREPAKKEIFNDLSGAIVNWWLCVRDEPVEFERRLRLTPRSRGLYEEAYEYLKTRTVRELGEPADLDWGVATDTVIWQSVHSGFGSGSWAVSYKKESGRITFPAKGWIERLAKRMSGVQLENRPAVEIIDRVSSFPYGLIYCDPPYITSDRKPYEYGEVEVKELLDVLRKVKGRVAISGYGSEWDALDWRRAEMKTTFRGMGIHMGNIEPRTEVLWMNFPAPKTLFG